MSGIVSHRVAALALALIPSTFAMTGLAATAPATAAPAPPIAPFAECPNAGFQLTWAGSGGSTLNRYDISTAALIPIKQLPWIANAIGYHESQRVFWALRSVNPGPDKLVRIDSAGNTDDYGVPVGLSDPTSFDGLAGAVIGDRLVVHTRQPANHLVEIDVNPASATFGTVTREIALSRTTGSLAYLNLGDWDVNDVDGKLYGIELMSTKRELVKIDPATGAVTDVATVTADLPNSDNYGAFFAEDGDSTFYTSANNVGVTSGQSQTFELRADANPVHVAAFGKGPALRVNDGADCLIATDFSDAPASYLTGDRAGGPGHVLSSYLQRGSKLAIGSGLDSDLDGFPSADADSDDKNLPVTDEDGVAAGATIDRNAPKISISVVNTTGAAAVVAGWIDFNGNGTFDAAERATATVASGGTSATLTWPAQRSAARKTTGARRLAHAGYGTPTAGPSPTPDRPPTGGGTSTGGGVTGGHSSANLQLKAAVTPTFLRLRIMPATVANPVPGGYVDGGEVEDHRIMLTTLLAVPPAAPPVDGNPVPVAQPVANPAVPGATTVDADGDGETADDVLAATGDPVSAYLRLGLGLVGFGGSIFGLAWLLGRRRRDEAIGEIAGKE
ncbi:hypothetical protein F4553_004791 [Allocatelliglobosispora scoriae]|uniref:DUF4394 domain-containing protein n=1 Tax=Allocatelliglobosispora scoriae TaxID=643052 RepID=A0A841BXC7_9ACTN|nr:GEVED domain-containing protein [Allocatelliglobosispora scoriae]MBB5871412.1 hypothetical protein [Allocatelliglobosispora scoriae]